MKRVDYADLKAFALEHGASVQYLDLVALGRYWIAALDGPFALDCELSKLNQADLVSDFEATLKPLGNKTIEQRYPDGRVISHTTPRKRGLITNFTAKDDDQTDHMKVGGGTNVTALKHLVGDAVSVTTYFDLNTIANETHIHSGTVQWEGAKLDIIEMTVVPKTTVYTAGVATNYNLYGGYLIIPAAPGTGTTTVGDGDRVLVQLPLNEFGNKTGAGYWDATFNTTTKLFENITPNYAGTGAFNMFGAAVTLDRFVHHQPLIGSGVFTFQSYDASMIGHGMRFKLVMTTVGTDHEWSWCVTMILYRKKTV